MSDLLSLAQTFLATLDPAQLELLGELLDELEPDEPDQARTLLAQPAASLQPAGLAALLSVVKRAQRRPASHDKEWNRELDYEVTAADKNSDRLVAVPSPAEIKTLIAAAHDNPRDELLLRVLYAAGLRRSEAGELKVGDVNFDDATLFIRSGKGDKDRYVLIDRETCRLLNRYTAALGPEASVFELSDRQINRIVKRYAEKTGLLERYAALGRNFTAHALRHAFATHSYEAGADPVDLQRLLGHDHIQTTNYYIHVGVRRLRQNYDRYHPLSQPDIER